MLVISASVGAGHDGAAAELTARLQRAGVGVDRRDFLDALPRWVGFVLRQGYPISVGRAPGFFEWLFRRLERPGWVQAVALAVCGWAGFRFGAGRPPATASSSPRTRWPARPWAGSRRPADSTRLWSPF
ncbi:hypothetical protein ACFQV8_10195 [Pseudonocardia benzenivorans]